MMTFLYNNRQASQVSIPFQYFVCNHFGHLNNEILYDIFCIYFTQGKRLKHRDIKIINYNYLECSQFECKYFLTLRQTLETMTIGLCTSTTVYNYFSIGEKIMQPYIYIYIQARKNQIQILCLSNYIYLLCNKFDLRLTTASLWHGYKT